MNRTALIFGVTGQDGSYLLESLLDKGYKVVGVSRRVSTGNTERIYHLLDDNNFALVEGDITDYSSVFRIIENHMPDEVYNLAAMSHVGTSFGQPLLSIEVTCKGCLNILEVIKEHCKTTRFYQASSSEMFGDSFSDGEDGNPYQDEDTRFNPQSPYAVAKLSAHHLVALYRKSYSLHASCGILFNHESERRGDRFVTKKISTYVADLYNYIADGGNPDSFPRLSLGNLDAKRDWGHAKDYVEAMWMMLQQDFPDDYVISTGETNSVRDFLISAFKHIGVDNYKDFVVIDPKFMRPSEVPYLRGSSAKAEEKMGWRHKVSFKELVKCMVSHDIEERASICKPLQTIKYAS
jgi:GDPmannose 4,6-dehydratase